MRPTSLHLRSDVQICSDGTAAGNAAIVCKQLQSLNCCTWDELSEMRTHLGLRSYQYHFRSCSMTVTTVTVTVAAVTVAAESLLVSHKRLNHIHWTVHCAL